MNDALLVVDVINKFDHDNGASLLASFRSRLSQMIETLAQARSRQARLIYVNDAGGDWSGDAPGFVQRAIDSGEGGDVVEALRPGAGECFMFKPRYSAFDYTPLAPVLEAEHVERILLIGAATEGCVVQSAIDARELGLKATILSHACATANEKLEGIALAYAADVGGVRVATSLNEAIAQTTEDGATQPPRPR
jgi:nicotinamidase-related amidase